LFDPRTQSFERFRHDDENPDSLSDDEITAMLWVGTWGGGINKVDPRTAQFGRNRHYEGDPDSLISGRVYAILEDTGGALWLRTEKGLDRSVSHPGDRRAFSHHLTKPDAPILDDYISLLFARRISSSDRERGHGLVRYRPLRSPPKRANEPTCATSPPPPYCRS
jgi:hypothetical protein